MKYLWLVMLLAVPLPRLVLADPGELTVGEAVERHLSPDVEFSRWTRDPQRLAEEAGDRLETREVLITEPETVKLKDVVPPIHFESGVAEVPDSTLAELRKVLEGMRNRANVRLNLVGHADDQPLSPALAERYGDNDGLSRERAGEVAEFFQRALDLPPDAVSYEWAGAAQPVATNSTEAGRAQNRRVEVEVWFDVFTDAVAEEEYVVAEDIRQIKVCRMETVCKLRYVDGHARRARVQNLVAPLNYDAASLAVTPGFLTQIQQTLENLSDRQNVVVRFIGHTDDTALAERDARIYGDHLSLSRARAHRVALEVEEALDLPALAVESDGFGESRNIASNATPAGRALNRRIEVEFWYDDALQELPGEPQLCPQDAASETVTRVYDPPSGEIPDLQLDEGQPVIPAGYLQKLERALAEVSDRTRPRLRFIGYTGNETLDRRTALVYGDDVGLSVARARRSREAVVAALGLDASQAEHEGRGYVQSKDVINGGFVQGQSSYVEVQVVYDELALLDDYEGVEVSPLTRELTPENPYALNLMRITVDGEPIDDPQRGSADVQRCTDVAMEQRDIRFTFDNLRAEPRLGVAASTDTVQIHSINPAVAVAAPVRFRMYTNYAPYIDRTEVRIFESSASTQSEPVAVLAVGADGSAEWRPDTQNFLGPVQEMKYLLRAYGTGGTFDETAPRTLWLAHSGVSPAELYARSAEPVVESVDRTGLGSFGDDTLALQNIPIGSGTVTVQGAGLTPDQQVWVAGHPVPLDAQGNFIAQSLLPEGSHTVEVALLDQEGSGELYLRDLEFKKTDWFYAGMADITWSQGSDSANAELFLGDNPDYDFDSAIEGRIAGFASGQFGKGWGLTASVDTREDELGNLFNNFFGEEPGALFRRIDPDYHYPTFGDDSTVQELAPTQGKLFLKLDKNDSYGLWGNYRVAYVDNELARLDRGLYGGQGHYESIAATSFGDKRFVVDGFAAEPGTVPSQEEFRATGGSLYYLHHQDILIGSENVRIEVRDKVSGLVTGVVNLAPSTDYDVDYLQGTVLLAKPLAATVNDTLLIRTGSNSGDEAYLVVRYEYRPGFDDVNALSAGGQMHYWLTDRVKVGVMANENSNDDSQFESSLKAGDLTYRLSSESWVKVQGGWSDGVQSQSLTSADGGYEFLDQNQPLLMDTSAAAYRGDVSIDLGDLTKRLEGRLTVYGQTQEAGYSAPGLETLTDTHSYGGTLQAPITKKLSVNGKSDMVSQDVGVDLAAHEINLAYQFNQRWNLSGGVRHDDRDVTSPVPLVTQDIGARTDAVLQLGFDARGRWSAYGFAQDTISASSERESNGRFGVGGEFMVSERLQMRGEISDGDQGFGGRVGTEYLQSERTSFYLNYALENERTDNGLRNTRGAEGSLVSGMKTRLSDSTSMYMEERYQHGSALTGLTHATGVTLAPADRWNLSVGSDIGTLKDTVTGAETDRTAGSVNLGFGTETLQLSSGVEYRNDETEQADASAAKRKTWLYRNTFRWQMTEASRLLGKFNYATSDNSMGAFFDGEYTEAVVGYAFRPVRNDRLNALVKYTYFYNMPTAGQVTQSNAASEYLQKSQIAAVDLTYDLTGRWRIGGKYAYRFGEISLTRDDPDYFDNSASLYVVRTDYRYRENWELLVEGRLLDMQDIGEQSAGALVAVSRYFGEHFKAGVGYNFTDFSDDLTDLDYDHQGLFVNLTGAF